MLTVPNLLVSCVIVTPDYSGQFSTGIVILCGHPKVPHHPGAPRPLVGQVGLEPTLYPTSRIYSPLQSPLCTLTHMAEDGGLEPPRGYPHVGFLDRCPTIRRIFRIALLVGARQVALTHPGFEPGTLQL